MQLLVAGLALSLGFGNVEEVESWLRDCGGSPEQDSDGSWVLECWVARDSGCSHKSARGMQGSSLRIRRLGDSGIRNQGVN